MPDWLCIFVDGNNSQLLMCEDCLLVFVPSIYVVNIVSVTVPL